MLCLMDHIFIDYEKAEYTKLMIQCMFYTYRTNTIELGHSRGTTIYYYMGDNNIFLHIGTVSCSRVKPVYIAVTPTVAVIKRWPAIHTGPMETLGPINLAVL